METRFLGNVSKSFEQYETVLGGPEIIVPKVGNFLSSKINPRKQPFFLKDQ